MKMLRNSYRVILKRYRKIGKKNVRLTQSSLLLEALIDSSKDTYKFPVLESEAPVLPEEIRLNINDEFVSYDVGYYVKVRQEIAGTPGTNFIFWTYAAAELHSVFLALEGAWLGVMQILVNKISRLEKWDLKKHNYVPRTQYQSSSAGIPAATQPSIDFADHGTIPMQPMVTLSGAKKNDIILSYVAAVPAALSADWVTPNGAAVTHVPTHLVLFFRGLLAQNAAKFQ
jgi:hypothetical protein